ncbi:thioredoxin family protein [Maribacter antarcticus]|uniref:thioredoxin family protein n=1 Tax=Maribacter antarcticus TaxID=505250 RepID=UPI000A592501|nr:thioredoxin family protein [Maribacter antarcticus]
MSQDWETSFEIAKSKSKKTQTPIILVFQGSDWCAPCIKLDREVWSTPVFQKYAAKNYVMLQADFPRKKINELSKEQTTANKILAEEYNQKGIFPLVVLLNEDGKELGQTGYKRLVPEAYIKELDSYLN